MKTIDKPYRLINTKELAYLQKKISPGLEQWNELYACEDLKLELSCVIETASKPFKFADSFNEQLLVKHIEKPIALLAINYLDAIKKTIFYETTNCFDPVCDALFKQLLEQLLSIESLEFTKNTTDKNDWLYPGAPCLLLKLGNRDSCLSLYLHPQWVLAQLPKPKLFAKSLCKPDEACAEKELQCSVELEPIYLSLEKLSRLQPGNVLKTSHPLCKPLLLRYQQQSIAEAEAGQQLQQKSIQLRRIM